ncbi:MAG: helix-turn-helix domain-containing protein [Dysgonamonadaceae bacterium]|nr:helix-turn-helix domain-containing protein [Dysgonamonadaceae bacterium]
MKYDSLRACVSGFYLSDYLRTRALAAIEKDKRPTTAVRPKVASVENTEIENPVLFERLRAWRYQKALEINKAVFVVFSQKTLYELVHYLPQDKHSLLKINGIGDAKAALYGDEIIEKIRTYCEENIIVPPDMTLQTSKSKSSKSAAAKQPKEDTREVTINLFKSGKTMPEIAIERGLALTTIEGHLSQLVAKGELDATKLIATEKLQEIVAYFKSTQDRTLSSAFAHFDGKYTYGELRIGYASTLF